MNKSDKTIPVLLKELKDLESKLTEAYKQKENCSLPEEHILLRREGIEQGL